MRRLTSKSTKCVSITCKLAPHALKRLDFLMESGVLSECFRPAKNLIAPLFRTVEDLAQNMHLANVTFHVNLTLKGVRKLIR